MVNPEANGLLPEEVVRDLLMRWQEPHRHYHGVSHLVGGLQALEELGGTRLERLAFWFHDAVHSNTTPEDERASAALVSELLGRYEDPRDIAEIRRLVLLTAGHHTETRDHAGQRVCDADLSGLGADHVTYRRNVAGIRQEMPHLSDLQWAAGRHAFLTRFLERERFFATDIGYGRWEQRARGNLSDERVELDAILQKDATHLDMTRQRERMEG